MSNRIKTSDLVIVVLLVAALGFRGACSLDRNTVTMEHFEQLDFDLTYDDAVEILGEPRDISTHFVDGQLHKETFVWRNSDDSGIELTFEKGRMSSMTKTGLR